MSCSAQPGAAASRKHQPHAGQKNAPRAPSHAVAAVEFLEVAAEETLKVISLQNRRFTCS